MTGLGSLGIARTSRVSVTARMLAFRLSAISWVAFLCVVMSVATVVYQSELRVPWWPAFMFFVLFGIAPATLPLQSERLRRQLESEEASGYTTDRWGTPLRPEVAPGTDVVIRPAGHRPIPLGEHRKALRWAHDVAAGVERPADFTPGEPVTDNRRTTSRGNPWAAGTVAGGFAYMAGLGIGVLGRMSWQLGLGLAVGFATVAVLVAVWLTRPRHNV